MTKLEPELYAAMITDINNFIERMSGGEVTSTLPPTVTLPV